MRPENEKPLGVELAERLEAYGKENGLKRRRELEELLVQCVAEMQQSDSEESDEETESDSGDEEDEKSSEDEAPPQKSARK